MTTEPSSLNDKNNNNEIEDENEIDGFEIIPNIEIKLSPEKRTTCREIVREIKRFGVNQRQILFLIQLLSLELENQKIMKSLIKVIGEYREDIPLGEDENKIKEIEQLKNQANKKKQLIL